MSNPQPDKHQYLLKSSCHPSHTKQSIPFSMALRLRRLICSKDEFFNTRSSALTTHLIKRGHKHRFVKDAIGKVRQIPRSKALETSIKRVPHQSFLQHVLFCHVCNRSLCIIPQVISVNLNHLRSSQRCLEAFSSPPGISYRRCKNLRDITGQGHWDTASNLHRLRELSVVTEIDARRVLHYRGKSVAEMTFSLAYILNVAFVALNHINETARRAGDVMSYAFLFVVRALTMVRGKKCKMWLVSTDALSKKLSRNNSLIN